MIEEITRLRRHLHTIPEESLKEVKTSAFIYDTLHSYGIKAQKVLDTGVLAFFDVGSETTIAFRADMDGLLTEEKNNVDYKSTHRGFMHACGHDGHMAALLMTAKKLQEHKAQLKENVLLIFQPAEESIGGAKKIIEAGILEKYRVRCIYATHVYPAVKEGKIATRSGYLMAQTGEFFVDVHGKSAHAAEPYNGIDSILALCKIIVEIDALKKELQARGEQFIINIGVIHGGERENIVAECASLYGTIRTYDSALREEIRARISELIHVVNDECGTEADIALAEMYPAVYNDEALYEDFAARFDVEMIEPCMTAEDFSYYQKEIPGLMFFTGVYNEEKGFVHPLHSNRFNFDECVLLRIVEIFLNLAGIREKV